MYTARSTEEDFLFLNKCIETSYLRFIDVEKLRFIIILKCYDVLDERPIIFRSCTS